MKRVVILTGDETRHTYVRKKLSNDGRFHVVGSFCEGVENSLAERTVRNEHATPIERLHVAARTQAEFDFFSEATSLLEERSGPVRVAKGEINSPAVVRRIIDLEPDLLACYGSSLVRSELLERFTGRFLNAHLGLSPYYRGSGTNVWPLINNEPHMVGVTFMHIDAGIDTGRIVHQIRADVFIGDSPHSIGTRLIRRMAETYADIIAKFDRLCDEVQPESEGRLYRNRDFDGSACAKLYANFRSGMIESYLMSRDTLELPYIVVNRGLGLGA